jgi:itaconate CoA-transferase
MDDVPALGQHSDAILSELGYSASDIERLHGEAAV